MKPQIVAKNNLAISYTRFSSAAQAAGDSERRQTEAAQAYCLKHGLVLTDKYRLQDSGKSAYKGIHRSATSALGQLEKQVAEGKIPVGTVLIVESLDRLSRQDIVKAQLLMLNLIDKGIEIVALADNERLYNYDTVTKNPTDLIMSIVILSRAHDESEKKSYRTKANWLQKRKLATQGKFIKTTLPGWLVYKEDKYELIHEKVKIIQRIFALYLRGYGVITISKILSKENAPPVAKSQRGKRLLWNPNYVTRLLRNKMVIGYYTKTSPEVPDFFPTVVSVADFYAVQAKLKERIHFKGQRNNNPFVFSHLLKCSLCGEAITRNTMSPKYCYLRCYGSVIGNCKAINISCPETEKALLEVIKTEDPSATASNDTHSSSINKEISTLKGKLSEVEKKIDQSAKLFLETPSETGSKIMQELEASRRVISKDLEHKLGIKHSHDNRPDWKQVKATLEAEIATKWLNPEIPESIQRKYGQYPVVTLYESVPKTNGEVEFIPIKEETKENNVIALRENLREYIDRININIQTMQADILFKNGRTVAVLFKKSKTRPRRYFYKTADTDWIEINAS